MQPLANALREDKHDVFIVEKPSSSATPVKNNTLADDIRVAQAQIQQACEKGNDVVVVGHSYGGHIASTSVKGFSCAERGDSTGAVIGLVYLCAFAPVDGASHHSSCGSNFPHWHVASSDKTCFLAPEESAHLFYNNLSEAEQKKWGATLVPHSYSTFYEEGLWAGWQRFPSTYLLCENDNAIPPVWQEMFVKQEGHKFVDVRRIQSDHSPMLSHIPETRDYLIESASLFRKA